MVSTGGFFAALGTKADNRQRALWLSLDGTTWHEATCPTVSGGLGLFGDGARLHLFGGRGTIHSTTCSGYATGRAPRRRLPFRP